MPSAAKKDVSGLPQPQRPMLPPFFLLGVAFWLACAAALSLARVLDIDALRSFSLASAVLALLLLVGIFVRLRQGFSILLPLLAVSCIGVLLGAAFGFQLKQQADAIAASGLSNGVVELQEDARRGVYGWECLATLRDGAGKQVIVSLRLKDAVKGDEPLRYGDCYQADFSLKSPRFDTSASCWNKGACAIADAKSLERCDGDFMKGLLLSVRNRAIDGYGKLSAHSFAANTESSGAEGNGRGAEPAAFLVALSCGYRSDLFDTAFYDDVKKCGLAHLVAVSGAHLTVVSAFVAAALSALRLPRRAVFVFSVATMLAYLVLSGCPVSAIRAAVMGVIASGSFLGGRRPSSLNALGVCALALVLFSPQTSLSVSFMLSFASTAGIILFASYIEYACRTLVRKLPLALAAPMSLTLASNIVCLPLSVSLFGQLPLVSLLANVVCGVLFSPLCLLALVFGLLFAFAPVAANALAFAALGAAQGFCALVSLLAGLPYACVPATCDWALAVALALLLPMLFWLFWPKITRLQAGIAAGALMACLLAFVFVLPVDPGTRIVMLDVGQGDSFLVQSDGATLLIDTGNQDKRLREALARNNVRKIDAVLITHADDDHCGSLRSLASSIDIGRVLLAADAKACTETNYRELLSRAQLAVGEVDFLEVGDILRVGKTTLRVLWPEKFSDAGGNADSVCCLGLTDIDGDGSADYASLFTGDIETAQLKKVAQKASIDDIDILKVSHHGSKTGLDDDLAKRLNAKIALISVGANNRYGHPNSEVLDSLQAANSQVFRSDERGDVSCKMTTSAIEVSTQR